MTQTVFRIEKIATKKQQENVTYNTLISISLQKAKKSEKNEENARIGY